MTTIEDMTEEKKKLKSLIKFHNARKSTTTTEQRKKGKGEKQ